MPVKVLGPNEEWVNANIVTGLNYAVNTPGVRAVNISLAGLNSPMPGIQNAMQNAENRSVLLVFAAGNWGADHDNPAFVPELRRHRLRQRADGGGERRTGTRSRSSPTTVRSTSTSRLRARAIAMDTIDGSDGATSYGTSFAAPLVTGVAALLFSAYPQATAAQVKQAICGGATQLPALMGKVRCGLLNAEGALQALGAMLDGPPAPAIDQRSDHRRRRHADRRPDDQCHDRQLDELADVVHVSVAGVGRTARRLVERIRLRRDDRVVHRRGRRRRQPPASHGDRRDAGGSASANSGATGVVVPLPPAGGVPTIAGTAQVGQVLTASPGTWSNSPTVVSATSGSARRPARPGRTPPARERRRRRTPSPPTDAGSYLRVTVTATNAGGSASASSSATATTVTANDTTAPTVSVTAPRSGSSISGTTTLSASASDNVGVTRVEFYVDGKLVATDTASPYTTSWNPATVALGTPLDHGQGL